MDESNLYPLDGAAFTTDPEPQVDEAKLEKAKAQAAGPLLEDIIERFDEQIDLLSRISSIPHETKMDTDKLLMNFHANDIAMRFLVGQKEWLEALLEDQR